jgi:hypothetical protein
MNRKYCCHLFESAVSAHGDRGLSIVLGKSTRLGIVGAFLEYRAIARNEHWDVTPPDGLRVVTATQNGILYCPWCGKSIRDFYLETDLPELDERTPFQEFND